MLEGSHSQSKQKLGHNGLPQPDGQGVSGSDGEAKEVATAVCEGESFRQRESRNTALM